MSMFIEVNGVPYDNILSAQVTIQLDVLCNSFSLIMTRDDLSPLPFRVGDSCRILVNQVPVLTGFIEMMDISYEAKPPSHSISVVGRDHTSDLADSYIDGLSDIQEGASLRSIIQQVISHIGSSLKVVQETTINSFNPVNDVASPESGDNAFKFCEKLARQRQVLLTSNGDGDVVISRGSGETINARLQNSIGATDNNVMKGSAKYDITKRYNNYTSSSFGNPSVSENAGEPDLNSIIERDGGAIDTQIRTGRQLVIDAESSFSIDDDFNRALWEANIRKARSRTYEATVSGYAIDGSDTGTSIWDINKLVPVVDDFANISETMLINTVVFSLDLDSGETSQLTLVDKDTYNLIIQESAIGEDFV